MVQVKAIAKKIFTTIILFSTVGLQAVSLTLKGGEELKQAAEIISTTVSLYSIKMFALLVLGFIVALQGLRMIFESIHIFIKENAESHKKSLALSIIGLLLFLGGITIVFYSEIMSTFRKEEIVVVVEEKTKEKKADKDFALEDAFAGKPLPSKAL